MSAMAQGRSRAFFNTDSISGLFLAANTDSITSSSVDPCRRLNQTPSTLHKLFSNTSACTIECV